ncbi:hypothetical protein M433DRAFT_148209 [Acidomyces richmondensis BFW]|nr:hypothetical protein M433DRAFT_148209 [Acidomyces richmondensis BFW]
MESNYILHRRRWSHIKLEEIFRGPLSTIWKAHNFENTWASKLWPSSGNLPEMFVVKEYSKRSGYKDPSVTMEREFACYRILSPLQGVTIPRCYGPVQLQGHDKPALALQFLEGITLWDIAQSAESTAYDTDAICRGIDKCFFDISQFGVIQEDAEHDKLDNLMYAKTPVPRPPHFYVLAASTCALLPVSVSLKIGFCTIAWLAYSCLQRKPMCKWSVFMIDFGYTRTDKIEHCIETNLASARELKRTFQDWTRERKQRCSSKNMETK